jgi:hypothetical protein
MPGEDGLTLARGVRARSQVPIQHGAGKLKHMLRKSAPEPPTPSAPQSDASSIAAPQPNAPTTSETPGMDKAKNVTL